VGERVRFYKATDGSVVWLPDVSDELSSEIGEEEPDDQGALTPDGVRANPLGRRDYDVAHYLQVLLTSYAGRLRKAFAPEDFDQIFRPDPQLGLFDRPIADIEPIRVRIP
jgi:hypothetical protein